MCSAAFLLKLVQGWRSSICMQYCQNLHIHKAAFFFSCPDNARTILQIVWTDMTKQRKGMRRDDHGLLVRYHYRFLYSTNNNIIYICTFLFKIIITNVDTSNTLMIYSEIQISAHLSQKMHDPMTSRDMHLTSVTKYGKRQYTS